MGFIIVVVKLYISEVMFQIYFKTLQCKHNVKQLGIGNGTIQRLWMKKRKSCIHPFHVEVVVEEGEPEERAISRFRRKVNQSGVVSESRRRMRFESNRDRKMRKLQEKFRKRRQKFEDEIETYDQVHGIIEPSPFQDLFGDDELMSGTTTSVNELIAMASGLKTAGSQSYTPQQYNAQRQNQYVPEDDYYQNQQQQQQQKQWYAEPEQEESWQ
eukprot:TRINITY_DN2986_c0_g1_i6.p1 TRINITY_DN2986_c0_g1~~TRINITY_DN2986_c0_g1_i6.p1  ORF type:complete len:213 (+),score=12.86 TRINITY_DN2986_c0_g1_i6:224-862(+)